MHSPTRRTGAEAHSRRSARQKANNDAIAAVNTIPLLSQCSWCPIGTVFDDSRAAHTASELGAHTSLHTVLSKAVATAKIPTAHHPLLVHRSPRTPTRAAAVARTRTTAAAKSPPRNHSLFGWSAAASSLIYRSGSGNVRVKKTSSSQLEYSTPATTAPTTATHRSTGKSDRRSRGISATESARRGGAIRP